MPVANMQARPPQYKGTNVRGDANDFRSYVVGQAPGNIVTAAGPGIRLMSEFEEKASKEAQEAKRVLAELQEKHNALLANMHGKDEELQRLKAPRSGGGLGAVVQGQQEKLRRLESEKSDLEARLRENDQVLRALNFEQEALKQLGIENRKLRQRNATLEATAQRNESELLHDKETFRLQMVQECSEEKRKMDAEIRRLREELDRVRRENAALQQRNDAGVRIRGEVRVDTLREMNGRQAVPPLHMLGQEFDVNFVRKLQGQLRAARAHIAQLESINETGNAALTALGNMSTPQDPLMTPDEKASFLAFVEAAKRSRCSENAYHMKAEHVHFIGKFARRHRIITAQP
jgi:hypothetical protein